MSDSDTSIAFEMEHRSGQEAAQSDNGMYPVENDAGMYPVEAKSATPTTNADAAHTPEFHIEPQGNQVSPPQWALNRNDSLSFQVESPTGQSLEAVSAPRSAKGANPVTAGDSIEFQVAPEPPRSHADSVVFQVTSVPSVPITPDANPALNTPPVNAAGPAAASEHDETAPHEITSSSELSTPRAAAAPTAAAAARAVSDAAAASHGTSSVQFLSVQSSAQEAPLQPATAVTRQETAPGENVPASASAASTEPHPPARLSRRAEAVVRERSATPRTPGRPKTPRTRSAGSSWVPVHRADTPTSVSSEDEYPTEAPAGPTAPEPETEEESVEPAPAATAVARPRPPLAPSSGAPAAAPAPQPTRYARAQSANSEFSAFDEGSNSDFGSIPRSERGQAPPGAAPMQSIIVTDQVVHVGGDQWGTILKASPDAVERAVVTDAAAAAGVEPAFINVMHVAADEEEQPGLVANIKIGHDANQTAEQVAAKLADSDLKETRTLYTLTMGEEPPVAGKAVAAAAEASAAVPATRAIGKAPSFDSDADSTATTETVEADAPTPAPEEEKEAESHGSSEQGSDEVHLVEEPAEANEANEAEVVGQREATPLQQAAQAADTVEPEAETPAKKTKKSKSKSRSKSPKTGSKKKKTGTRSPSKSPKKAGKKKTAASQNRTSRGASARPSRAAPTPAETTAPTYSPYQDRKLPRELTTPRTYTPRTPRAGADETPRLTSRAYPGMAGSTERRASSSSRGSYTARDSDAHSLASRPTLQSVSTARVPPQIVQRAVRPITPRSAYRSQARPVLSASAGPAQNARAAPAPVSQSGASSTTSPQHPSAQPRDHSPEQIREDQAVATEIRARQLLQQLRVHNESVQRSQGRASHAPESTHDPNSPPRGRETPSVSRRSHSRHQSPTRVGGRGGSPGTSPLPRPASYTVEDAIDEPEMEMIAPTAQPIAVA